MLKMAAVNKSDVVYDLGCGERPHHHHRRPALSGCRGRGLRPPIPSGIRECLENAKKAGVTGEGEIRRSDLFQADFQRGHRPADCTC